MGRESGGNGPKMNETSQNAIEKITALRVRARNNRTLVNEQDITTWECHGAGLSQVDVAIGLDRTNEEAIERRGYSGIGAGAVLLATIDGDEEEIESMSHPAVATLPVGDVRQLRHYISEARDSQVWDGHNHVCAGACYSQELLRAIRSGKTNG